MAARAAAREESPGESARRAKPALPPRPGPRAEDKIAAENLGAVYIYLAKAKALPFDDWANPTAKTGMSAIEHGPLDAALQKVYGTDRAIAAKNKGKPWRDDYSFYKSDFDCVIPKVREAAFRLTPRALTEEERVLRKLHASLASDVQLGNRLHKAAQRIKAAAPWPFEDPWPPDPEMPWKEDEDKRRRREQLVPLVSKQHDSVLSTLFVHPSGVQILRAYSEGEDGSAGAKVAVPLVEEAVGAVRGFREDLAAAPYHIWRYPPFVWLGVRELRLGGVRGFKQYTASIGQVLGRNPNAKYFNFAGQALGLLAMVFLGPEGVGIPAAVAAFASGGLLVAGTELGFAYLQDRERDLGAGASVHRKKGQEFVTSATYLDTALAGAAALVAGIAFFGAMREFGALIGAAHAESLDIPAQVLRPSASPSADAAATSMNSLSQDAKGLGQGARAIGAETKAVPIPEKPTGSPAATVDTPAVASPQETTLPKKEPGLPETKDTRASGEPVEPSSRSLGPTEQSSAAKATAERAVLDSPAAVEKRVASEVKQLLLNNPDLDAARKAIDGLIQDLSARPENADLVRAIRVARDALEDPERIARVVAKIRAEAQRLTGIPPTAQEQALGLEKASSRAVARLAGLSPETLPQFKAIPKGVKDLGASQFFEGYARDSFVVDWQIGSEGGHGVMTHIVQDLVIEDAFAQAGIRLDGREFRMKLGSAQGASGPGKPYILGKDPDPISVGNKVFVELYDSSLNEGTPDQLGTPHRPETLYTILGKTLSDLD
jgi:hypothetical protein